MKVVSTTDFLLCLTCCSLMLTAIRQSENGHELLEKTLLKLRVDQKGNRSTISFNISNYGIQKLNEKTSLSEVDEINESVSSLLFVPFPPSSCDPVLTLTPLRVAPALLCGLEHQRQKLPERPGHPPGAPHTPAARGAAAVPGRPSPPRGTHPIYRCVCVCFPVTNLSLLGPLTSGSYLEPINTSLKKQRMGRIMF